MERKDRTRGLVIRTVRTVRLERPGEGTEKIEQKGQNINAVQYRTFSK
jgi:hypothetical protein